MTKDSIWTVRAREEIDIPGIIGLMTRVYPQDRFGPHAIWKDVNLRRHMARFPEGQMVAFSQVGRLVGTSTTLRMEPAVALNPHTWGDITGHGTLETHQPEGEVLYGVNIAVDPDFQGRGVARALYQARIDLARSLGCADFAAGARIPGYSACSRDVDPETYLQEVASGARFDPTLSKQLALGFKLVCLLREYAPDPETCNHAALIRMELT